MANLIITIIAIALTAILAIAGAWYGSSAFMEGQAKGRANKIVSDFKQVDAAIKLWAVENAAGMLPDVPTDHPINFASTTNASFGEMASFLEPKYLATGTITSNGIRFGRVTSWGMTTSTLQVWDGGAGEYGLNEAVCKQLEAMRTGSAPATLRSSFTGVNNTVNKILCGQVGCFYDPGVSWGTSLYVAYWRLDGIPRNDLPDCTINP